ncbi:CWC16 protein [Microdochium bolleyi]|uniref:CWC16 protein n=1 Tax=Microdochium bolleyi TaxID=196109 RepID=A0A136IY71_9PEZI|nr:CWC16 protein [Microdochium bolleyi]
MQGFNMGRYVPPDLEGTTSGNKLHSKKPPGQRTRASDGTLQQTVRFEMPFAVWCGTCPKPTIIGQGVRFNAVKARVGSYHSTPVWSFTMRHAACGGELEVRTDPANTAYVVARGGRKRDTGEDKAALEDAVGEGGLRILTDREREEMRASAFKQLERTIEDREHAAQAKVRIEEIEDAQAKVWEDPYAANARLRREFRVGRHEREEAGRQAEDLKDRMSLGFDLLPEHAADAKRAALVDFRPAEEDQVDGSKALAKPLFASVARSSGSASRDVSRTPDRGRAASAPSTGKKAKPKRLKKSEIAAARQRDSFVSEVVGNTRIATDPFLAAFSTTEGRAQSTATTRAIVGIKRKQPGDGMQGGTSGAESSATSSTMESARDGEKEDGAKGAGSSLAMLVEYDSD